MTRPFHIHTSSRCVALPTILLLGVLFSPTSIAAQGLGLAGSGGACHTDAIAPRNIVQVYERQVGRADRVLHDGAVVAPEVCVRGGLVAGTFDDEVDTRSAVAIRFRRDYLRSLPTRDVGDAMIRVSAHFVRDGKENPLEVEGFFKVGQASKRNAIASRSFGPYLEAVAMLQVLRNSAADAGTRRIVEAAAPNDKDPEKIRLQALQDSIRKVAQMRDALVRDLQTRSAELEKGIADSARAPQEADMVSLRDTLRAKRAAVLVAQTAVESARAKAQSLANERTFETARVRGEVALIAADSVTLRHALERLQEAAIRRDSHLRIVLGVNADLLSVRVARAKVAATELYGAMIEEARLSSLVTDQNTGSQAAADAAMTTLRTSASRLLGALRELSENIPSTRDAAAIVADYDLQSLPDGSIDLRTSPVTDGDRVVIKIEVRNGEAGEGEDVVPRTMILNLIARSFGVRWSLTDGAILLRRRAQSEEADARLEQLGSSAATQKGGRFASDVNFSPTASVLWAARPTLRQKGTGIERYSRAFVRMFSPSIGLNVSAPKFSSRSITVEEGKIVDSPIESAFDLGLGIGIGFFEEKIQLVFGQAPTAKTHRGFWALGLSFARVVDGRLNLAGSGSK